MKNLILFILLSGLHFTASAADGDYAVSKIPAELLLNANAVVRSSKTRFEVINTRKAIYYYKVAYTILNEKGDGFAGCHEYYDKLQGINFIEGTLFDKDGKKVKTLKKADISDLSGTDEGSLADDNRIKYHNFYCKNYPYTVEYEVEVKYSYTMFYPNWYPQRGENLSVQSAEMQIVLPENLDFRYKSFNIKNEVAIEKDKSSKIYSWSVKDIKPIERETFGPNWMEIAPVILAAPVQFAIDDYEGNMSTWLDYGKFMYALNAGRDILPENVRSDVHQLTDRITDPSEKVSVLYNYLQKNTRYISIQLGVGGWQTFTAAYVAEKRYGDCKALVNYMYSLLKEAGVKSYQTLVKSGRGNNYFNPDFPSSQFDHVILCVPVQKDTIWLECTNQTIPAGYLGSFTDNRYVLLIDQNGGKLIKTPDYAIKDNLQVRTINAVVDAEGNMEMNILTDYKAIQQDGLHSLINSFTKEKVLDYLKEEIDLPNYDVVSFNYKELPGTLPSVNENLRIKANNYAQVSGKRIFVTSNTISRSGMKLLTNEKRNYDIFMRTKYLDLDTAYIEIPAGYQPESIPKDLAIDSRFGKYSTSVVFSDSKITYYRRMEQFGGHFPASDYDDLVKFYDQIYKADRAKVVLIKQ